MEPTTRTVLRPGSPGYDAARLGFQTHASQAPAAVVVARDAGDVADAVLLARREGRRIAVQATGHGVGAVDPEAVLVNTAALDDVVVDPSARTARIGAGARWGAVIAEAARHGLAPLSGSSPGVGVVGYLVHGGVPILGRQFGWAADRVRAFEVVLADGSFARVDDGDPFWALRGGGGSFALVTAVEIELVALRDVYGGSLFLPADDVPATLRAWRDWARTAPDELSTSVAVIPFPDVDGPPPPLRGRTAVAIRVAWTGSAAEGAELVAPMRAVATPLLDDVRERPWTDSASIHRDPPGPAGSVGTTLALSALDDHAVEAAAATITGGGARRVVEIRRLGGALTRPVAGSGPVRRDAEWSAGTVTILAPGASVAEAGARDAAFRAALAHVRVGRLANFLFGEGADPSAVESAYSAADLARLRATRRAADPDGLFLASAPIQ